jgi:hypothetical protein
MLKAITVTLDDEFDWMADRLAESIETNCPGMELRRIRTKAFSETKWMPKFITDNFTKLQVWDTWLGEQSEGQLVFIDADTLVLSPLQPVFEEDFDVCYTVRPGRVPFNNGVIFARANGRTKRFFGQWRKHNFRLVKNQGKMVHLIRGYAGGNQWAFQQCIDDIENGKFNCRVHAVPCAKWNCEQETWREFNGKTAIVHIKSLLRGHLLSYMPWETEEQAAEMEPVVRTCRAYGW